MNEIFRKEWELYRQGGARPAFRGVEKKDWPKGFDGPVKVGEVRIFADMNRPFVALVVEDRGKIGWRIVPVSPFTVPASVREVLVGERVYQLWNACTAARSFVERSWVVETLAADDVVDVVVAALGEVASGAVSVDETAREYERAFRVAGGDFGVWTADAAPRRVAWWRRRTSWGIAAMLLICCGIGGLWHGATLECQIDPCVCVYAPPSHEEVAAAAADEALDEFAPDAIPADSDRKSKMPLGQVEAKPGAGEKFRRVAAPREECYSLKSAVTMKSMAGSRESGSLGGTMFCGGTMSCGNVDGDSIVVSSPSRSGERYATVVENEFLNPQSEPLSTFGLDVDTSSYALMRSTINDQKRLPWQQNSVRIEEYVNYFKYAYPQPKGDEPVAVDCELAACPWNAKHQLLRLGVQAKTVDEAKLPPCNLTFLVDVSGSMEGADRIGLLKQGLKMLVGKLRDEDHVAIVTYANDTFVRLPSVSGREKRAINSVIDELYASGGTAGGDGIQRAYAEAQKNFDQKANNRVILVTDGDFNIGISTPEELEKFIATKRESGIFLTVLGVGRGNYQDANMKKLANAGNGNYAYLDSVLEAKKVMLNEFGGTLMTVAKDVKVQIEFNPSEVEGYRLLGYENRLLKAHEFNDDRKDAGEIGSGHTMAAFYEIVPAGTDEKIAAVDPLKYQKSEGSGKGELFTVKTRYKLPNAETSVLREQAHTAAELTRQEPSEDFRFASAVAEFALLLKGSKFKGAASYTNLIERARNAKGADREGYRAEFIRLAETAELLSANAARIPQTIGRAHVNCCYSDVPTESAVVKALRELKRTQADDGSWGTNKVADTAWTVLAFLWHGEVPGSSSSKEFGDTVRRGIEFLIDAADKASDSDVALAAYALVVAYDMTRNSNVADATVGLFRRMKVMETADPVDQWLRAEACWLAQVTKCSTSADVDLRQMANEMAAATTKWWTAFDAKGDDIAYKCRVRMLDLGATKELSMKDALRLADLMRNWKPDDARATLSTFCAALCKYGLGVRAGARQEDINDWIEWNKTMKTYLKQKLANTSNVAETSQRISLATICYRYRRSLPFVPPSQPESGSCPPEVQVEVDL